DGAGEAHHEAEVRDQTVVDAEDRRAERAAAARAVPGFAVHDRLHAGAALQILQRLAMRLFLFRQARRLRLIRIALLVPAPDAAHDRQDAFRAEKAREEAQHLDARARRIIRHGHAGGFQKTCPAIGVALFGLSKLLEDRRALAVLLDRRQR